MGYRYINPGFADLCETGTVKQSDNDAAKNPYNNGENIMIDDTEKPTIIFPEGLSEIWIKYGVYSTNNNDHYSGFIAPDRNFNTGTGIKINGVSVQAIVKGTVKDGIIGSFARNTYHEIMFHLKVSSTQTENIFQVWIDGEQIYNGSGEAYLTSDTIYGVRLMKVSYGYDFVSNIIVSDEEIKPTEKVLILAAGSTSTDMTTNTDGTYTATAAGQTLLQAIDAAKIPNNIKITGVNTVVTGSYDGEGFSHITAIKKGADGATVEAGTYSLPCINTDTRLQQYSGLTADDLKSTSFGWKSTV